MNQVESLRNPNCKLCILHKRSNHICLMGKGPIGAKLMFIGEAPGQEEDMKGEPFIGRAGKMLDSVMTNITPKIDRKKVFITNLVKCRPPLNSIPKVAEMDACSVKYLRREIQLVKPELIVCLGGTSGKYLLQDVNAGAIDKLRENIWYTKSPLPAGIPFIITYHPAGVLRQPHLLEFLADDLEWAQRLINGELPQPKKKVNYQQLERIREIPDIHIAKWIDLDLETDGLDPFLPDKEILSLQISIKEGEAYYFDWSPTIGRQLANLLKAYTDDQIPSSLLRRINGHNIKFDLKWLRTKAGIYWNGIVNDTEQNIHLLDENFPSKGLDVVASSFTELKGHKDKFKNLIRNYIKIHKEKKEGIRVAYARMYKQAFFSIPLKTRVEYGCGDADATRRLRREFRPRLKADGLLPLHQLMMNATKMYVDVECNGIRVDERLVEEFDKKYSKKIRILKRTLDKLSPIELNHNAPLQLQRLLYGKWKLPPHEIRMGKKRVKYSTGKDALDLLLKDDIKESRKKYIRGILEFRKVTKLHGTYIKGMPRFLRDGFIHPTWRLDGTDTGRTSCNNPNLQQIPRTGDIKELFISRYRDGVLMQVDVSQGELRIAAHLANEPTLIKLFNSGTADIHRAVAAEALHKSEKEVTEDERYNYKQVNFAVLFGSGPKTVAQEMTNATVKQATELIDAWHDRFSRWKEYCHEQEEFVINNHYVRNLFGRYRRLFVLDPNSDEGALALRQAINSPIQGSLSDYNKLCGYNVWSKLQLIRDTSELPLFIAEGHDAWLLDIRKKDVPVMSQTIKEEFENVDTFTNFGFNFKVPMKVEIKVGPNWKEMEEYES